MNVGLILADLDLDQFEQQLGHRFGDRALLLRALTHRSYSHEAREQGVADNETLEFLGDAVLGFVIGDQIFRRFPELDEGSLSKMKAYLVSARSLAQKAQALEMGRVFLLGVGEERSGGRRKDSLLANLYEAVVAAVYLDGGIDAAADFILRTFEEDLSSISEDDLMFHDYKTALQEIAQGRGWPLPEYRVIDETGPDHDKRFVVEVRTGDCTARGTGTSKKEAQQQAAREALALSSESQ
jgi:ribonuclease III